MSAHCLTTVHIPDLPACLANKPKIKEYIEDYHHIGEISHINIINTGDVHSAFVHFKCPWNNGKVSNTIRKTIVEKGMWEESIRPGFGWLDWLPKGDILHI